MALIATSVLLTAAVSHAQADIIFIKVHVFQAVPLLHLRMQLSVLLVVTAVPLALRLPIA